MKSRITTVPSLTPAETRAVRALARVPIDQQQAARILLVRALRRRGFSRRDIAMFLRLGDNQVPD